MYVHCDSRTRLGVFAGGFFGLPLDFTIVSLSFTGYLYHTFTMQGSFPPRFVTTIVFWAQDWDTKSCMILPSWPGFVCNQSVCEWEFVATFRAFLKVETLKENVLLIFHYIMIPHDIIPAASLLPCLIPEQAMSAAQASCFYFCGE